MLLKSGYSRSKDEPKEFRELTIDELKNVRSDFHLSHCTKAVDREGNWRNIKITSVKTWKTRPNDVDIHWKYGLYEYGITSYVKGGLVSGPMLVIEVEK